MDVDYNASYCARYLKDRKRQCTAKYSSYEFTTYFECGGELLHKLGDEALDLQLLSEFFSWH